MQKTFIIIILILCITGCNQKKNEREVISSSEAPAAIGPYSQAIKVGNILYLAGQIGMDPETGKFAGEDFESQAIQALENQKAVLKQAGFELADVIQCQVFVTDLNNYPNFNIIYKEYFKKDFPARAVLEVSRIPADGLVEIMMVAVKTN